MFTATDIQSLTIIETSDSTYEVNEGEKCFRLVHTFGANVGGQPVGQWQSYQRMSKITLGASTNFAWLLETAGRSARIGFVNTSPVVGIHNDEERAA
jgi:hypothetical protein